ncbi:glycosyl hydrolase family 28 protein [Mariniflexile litorale]|uniref:Glycosyl hydrolase family 28 protein n=1 Tax=Mariniflexile litorale TaxID=3045158 RepID=A0AAU7EBR7_9FLAO|nr:glycosyl hydrolase family 28 protein [Mariniflexile sp. KMM 9835]MDQ8213462.1 glycosyl hydrolase family 28 protein [Mariniflexile sp. KMM 9835]
MKKSLSIIITLICFQISAQDNLVIYEVPGGYKYSAHNDDFTVLVREPDGVWKDLFEYEVEVDLDTKSKASMVHFDFDKKVELKVRKNNGIIYNVDIRPKSSGVNPTVKGNEITFMLDKSMNLSLEINGDKLHNLHIFANPIEKNRPDPNDPNVIYFGPGVHQPNDQPGDVYHIPSGKTVYVHGGAIIKAKFLVNKAEDVKIIGRGIVMQPERGVEIRYSKNVTVDGLIFINPKHYTIYGGETNGLTIKNIKSFSSQGWSDGIDLMSCSNVEIDKVFMRNSDDCIAIYAHRWGFYGDARNYEIKNSILWADIAHPTNIGIHGNAEQEGEIIENIHFYNIDILEHDEDDRNYQGCLAISGSDKNLIKNIKYEDIRIDNIQEGQLFNFRVFFNEKYSAAPGRNIEGVVLKNITYTGRLPNPSLIQGYSENEQIINVTIQNLKINDKVISKQDDTFFTIGEFTNDIKFKK